MKRMERVDFYGGDDPVALPLYSYAEAARIVGLPPTTVRYWLKGGVVTSLRPTGRFAPVLTADVTSGVSFQNLLELQILRVLRHDHRVPMESIRTAQRYASHEMGIERPLLSEILVGGRDIFVRGVGRLVSLNRSGQLAMAELLARFLHRVDFDEVGTPTRFFPVVPSTDERKSVQLSPRVRFGAPTLAGTGIATYVIASRVDEGEEVAAIAADYAVGARLVLDAVIFEAGRAG